MANDLLRGYLQLASGISELARARTLGLISGVLDLEAVKYLFRQEVEAAAGRLGLVSAEELEQARDQVRRLQAQIAQLRPPVAAVPDIIAVPGADDLGDPEVGPGAVPGPSGATGTRRRAPRSATKRARPPKTGASSGSPTGSPTDVGAKDRGAKKSAAKKALRSAAGKRSAQAADEPAPDEPAPDEPKSAAASADVFADAGVGAEPAELESTAERPGTAERSGTAKRPGTAKRSGTAERSGTAKRPGTAKRSASKKSAATTVLSSADAVGGVGDATPKDEAPKDVAPDEVAPEGTAGPVSDDDIPAGPNDSAANSDDRVASVEDGAP